MKKREAAKLVAGSIAVYVVVACSSAAVRPSSSALARIDDAAVSPADADPNLSGTRLKAKYYVGPDGSKFFAGIHDSQLNADCTFGTSSDGTTRCLPLGGPTISNFFSDAACSQPLGSTSSAACNVAPFVLLNATDACGATSTRVLSAPAYAGVAYYGSQFDCLTVSTNANFATYAFYQVGNELPPAQLAQATLQTDP